MICRQMTFREKKFWIQMLMQKPLVSFFRSIEAIIMTLLMANIIIQETIILVQQYFS